MRTITLALIGFGHVGQAFARLLLKKSAELENLYGLRFLVTGIATARHGTAVSSGGILLTRALEQVARGLPLGPLSEQPTPGSIEDYIYSSNAEILIESIPVNHFTGQPALNYLKAGLNKGMHVITANKGPVAHGYHELTALAARSGKRFLFESAVMDGAPIFSLFRAGMPAVEVRGFTGILNSCTNFILCEMEAGATLEEAVVKAASIGLTETDALNDLQGWDAAIKIAALVNVIMGIPLKPQAVERAELTDITPEMIQEAASAGERWKLVCTARRQGNQLLEASIKPVRVGPGSRLYTINGSSSYIEFETDMLPGLGIVESDPGPETTAYGLLADLINAVRGM